VSATGLARSTDGLTLGRAEHKDDEAGIHLSCDGHHDGTDITGGWFSEDSGHLQVVLTMYSNIWDPQHDDADPNGAGYAMIFTLAGQTRYVMAFAQPLSDGPAAFLYGSYVPADADPFVQEGFTTGSVIFGYGGGAIIDVPSDVMGITAGTRLSSPFVLTYDGIYSHQRTPSSAGGLMGVLRSRRRLVVAA
jgi:hypothetical protein